MDNNHQTPYPDDGEPYSPQGMHHSDVTPLSPPKPAHYAPQTSTSTSYPDQSLSTAYSQEQEVRIAKKFEKTNPNDSVVKQTLKLDKKLRRRLYWMVPLGLFIIALFVLFEVYKSDFERWVKPLADWLRQREAWSWVIPVVILIIISFPPLFGHEIVQLIVGLTYPIGVAIGIACAGAVLGEAACFVVFKYRFTSWVDKRIATKVKWAAIARVSREAGFRGVLVIRYSIVPPHLANPLFSCTGMKFWLYMITVILSLPKSIVFVILGTPSSEHSKGAKYAKVIAIGILVVVTIFASRWIRQKMKVATEEIEAERAISQGANDVEMGGQPSHSVHPDGGANMYQGGAAPYPNSPVEQSPYNGTTGSAPYQPSYNAPRTRA